MRCGGTRAQVQITIAHRIGGNKRDVLIGREIIEIKSVSLVEVIEDDIGYISMRQTRFSERTSEEVEQAVKRLMAEKVSGIVLHLRGNPGGLLTQATQVADLFLPKGAQSFPYASAMVVVKKQRPRSVSPLGATLLAIVLIDDSSASASEIVAGAIQDNDRGVLIN